MKDARVMVESSDDETEPECPRTEVYLPTLEEIAAMCAEFQAGWTPQERERRWTGPKAATWTVPGISQHGERLERAAEQEFRSSK